MKEYDIKTFNNEFSVNGLDMEYVYGNLEAKRKEEIFAMWDAHTPISKEAQEKRIDQVVYIIKQADKVVGVTTAYLQKVNFNNKMYYFLRAFFHPDIRGNIGTGFISLIRATREQIQKINEKDNLAEGAVIITENKKFMRPGFRKLFRKIDWKYIGQTKNKQDIWLYSFQ